MKRRIFCELTTITVMGTLLPIISCTSQDPSLKYKLRHPHTLSFLNDHESLIELGDAFIKKTLGKDEPEKIVSILMTDIEGRQVHSTDSLELQDLMEKKVKHDFNNGKTIVINGWVLSVTEARQCALYSLTQTKP